MKHCFPVVSMLVLLILNGSQYISSGSFSHILDCFVEVTTVEIPGEPDDTFPGGCWPIRTVSQPAPCTQAQPCRTNPTGITHPRGWTDESGSLIQIPICVVDDGVNDCSTEAPFSNICLVEPLKRAIKTWNELAPTMSNCSIPTSSNPAGCPTWEDSAAPVLKFHAESILLHELGHCAMGLDHPNMNWDTNAPPDGMFQPTSFTRSTNAQKPLSGTPSGGIDPGTDGTPPIQGSFDDFHEDTMGNDTPAKNVGWYRKSDNNPVIVDNTAIDINSYTRKRNQFGQDLPPGHNWPANANRRVTGPKLPGVPDPISDQTKTTLYSSTAVMYSLTAALHEFHALSADDVNMVKMGMTGKDREVGLDDYTIELIYSENCNNITDVLVELSLVEIDPAVPAQCENARLDFSFDQNPGTAQHYSIVTPDPTSFPLKIKLNKGLNWYFDPPKIIFADGLESDVFPWSSSSP